MIASLPMYDWPEVREATDTLWSLMARKLGVSFPLSRVADYTNTWRDSALLFGQTCGYPFTHEFRNKLTYVTTPIYAVDGCVGASYQSLVLAREKKPLPAYRGAFAAVNNPDSMSGMLALKLTFAPHAESGAFFASALETGGHVKSMQAVRDGLADVCAIDAVCVALARRYRPDYLEGLVEIARSPLVPALPFVTRAGDPVRLREVLNQTLADPAAKQAADALFLKGTENIEPQAYDRILLLETAMEKTGGLRLL